MTTRDPFGQPDEIAHATPVVSERAARGCVRPDEALEAHARGELELSEFERGEIAQFPEVWFTGLPGGAKPSPRRDAPGEVSGAPPSDFGKFADARLDYAGLACAGDHLAYRYEIERVIGKGSFAKVAQCFDHKRNERVAVKVVRDAPRFHKQVEMEIAALRALGGARGCVELLDVFAFRGHRCLVFELLSMSLRDWLTTHAPTPTANRKTAVVGASVGMCRRVAGQLLASLAFLAEKSVIHRDVKLENVLLRRADASEIVLVDFGSACFANEPRKHAMYVQSRHYRAPEVLLGAAYDAQIDVWSLGCVLAELHAGTPAFPGRDEADQLARIAEVIGPPPERVLRRGDEKNRRAWAEALERTRATEKNTRATEAIVAGATIVGDDHRRRVGVPGSRSMRDALDGCDDGDFVDFVSKCLTWGADERLTPGRALLHPWTGGMGLLNFTRALRIEPPRANASVVRASGGEKVSGDFVRRRNGTLSRPFSEPPPRDVGDPREAERRDAFFRSIPAVVQVEKKKVSLTSVMNAIAKDGQKTFRSRVRSAAAESTTRRARDEKEKNAIRPNRSVRFADEEESFVGGIPGGLAGEVMHLPTEPSMLPPLPGMTEQIAARIAEIRELQASYAVPTGPPPPPPTESARRYSGVNPKMAEDEYYTERFHGRAAGRGREERAR